MGKAFKRLNKPRKDLVVSTKFFKCGPGINTGMLSRKHLIEGIHASLERLQLDYVDIAFAHRYDYETPIEEVCRAFNWMIDKGKTFYWATSEWTPEQIMEANICCDRLGLIKPIADQAEYNMMIRKRFEVDLAPIYEKSGYGTTIWSPLASGMLTGKYNDEKVPEGSRFATDKLTQGMKDMIMTKYKGILGDQFYEKLRALGALAKEVGCTQAQLSLAWCLVNKDVSTCLIGASKPEQVVENMGALEVAKKWTPELEKKIEDIMKTAPTPDFNWRYWKSLEPRRQMRLDVKKETKQPSTQPYIYI
eukprot:TRINITY_DN49_c2_g1_i1.p2 TRINITY_DN49_c2_g1~~TRINITY_DN49_c2_g1_i1.p2  ORF type:complete len:305 (+),score=47.66 TRINITY_DN49_c2_g1_i1:2298-3212(+)